VESTVQDYDFSEVKSSKRQTSTHTLQETSASVELPPKAVSARKFFAPLTTTDADSNNVYADRTLTVKEAPRKTSRPPPLVMTATRNLIRIQCDLKGHIKGKCEIRNTQEEASIVTRETGKYAAVTWNLTKNNLHCFTFSLHSEKPIKAVTGHLPPDAPEEDNSNGREDSVSESSA
jgi:hypothetical protein